MTSSALSRLALSYNPFEPSGTGPPLGMTLTLPTKLSEGIEKAISSQEIGRGIKTVLVVGEYGSGKTCVLRWAHQNLFPSRRIKSFYFDNPGVQFYDIANDLLRTIGRKDFAKFVWETAESHVKDIQGSLFHKGFEAYLYNARTLAQRSQLTVNLQEAIKSAGITSDEEIAFCISKIVTNTTEKPYFEYRDFVPRLAGSIVAEREEAPYFGAILKTIAKGFGANGIAFLIDEFEEIGLQKRLTARAAHDYLATLKRLVNLAQQEDMNFWILLSMTPNALEITRELEPALMERIQSNRIEVKPCLENEAMLMVKRRIEAARMPKIRTGGLFPFAEDVSFSPSIYSNPRRLVKACFLAISEASESTTLPFEQSYIRSIEKRLGVDSGSDTED